MNLHSINVCSHEPLIMITEHCDLVLNKHIPLHFIKLRIFHISIHVVCIIILWSKFRYNYRPEWQNANQIFKMDVHFIDSKNLEEKNSKSHTFLWYAMANIPYRYPVSYILSLLSLLLLILTISLDTSDFRIYF